jgi:hypothetical protein
VGPGATEFFDTDGSAQLWSDEVGTACADAGFTYGATFVQPDTGPVCIVPLPQGTLIYSVPNGSPAYFAASLDTYTGFNLPAGTWYVLEFTEEFAHVWVTCTGNPVYIPIGNVVR